jgi:hypothetical protein
MENERGQGLDPAPLISFSATIHSVVSSILKDDPCRISTVSSIYNPYDIPINLTEVIKSKLEFWSTTGKVVGSSSSTVSDSDG